MPQSNITEKQAEAYLIKLDNRNQQEAEDAFLKLRSYLVANKIRFADLADGNTDFGSAEDLKKKFEEATKKNRQLKEKIKSLESRYSQLKTELNSI